MVFSELLDLIHYERNLSVDDLSKEMGISISRFKNLLYKRILIPDATTCRKILSYCKKYSIDTRELDWNEITYEFFLTSGKYADYQWEADLDCNNNIMVKHKTCGGYTLAPITAFDGKSMLCAHCLFNQSASENYILSINKQNNGYEIFSRTCLHQYPITYEQIKQGKYRCPQCLKIFKRNKQRKEIVDNLQALRVPNECITHFQNDGTIYLVNGKVTIPINEKTFPKLFDFIQLLQSRQDTIVYAVFNEPTIYGEPTDIYVLLCMQESLTDNERYKVLKKGNLCRIMTYNWREYDDMSEPTLSYFQISDSGVWCLPHTIARGIKF